MPSFSTAVARAICTSSLCHTRSGLLGFHTLEARKFMAGFGIFVRRFVGRLLPESASHGLRGTHAFQRNSAACQFFHQSFFRQMSNPLAAPEPACPATKLQKRHVLSYVLFFFGNGTIDDDTLANHISDQLRFSSFGQLSLWQFSEAVNFLFTGDSFQLPAHVQPSLLRSLPHADGSSRQRPLPADLLLFLNFNVPELVSSLATLGLQGCLQRQSFHFGLNPVTERWQFHVSGGLRHRPADVPVSRIISWAINVFLFDLHLLITNSSSYGADMLAWQSVR